MPLPAFVGPLAASLGATAGGAANALLADDPKEAQMGPVRGGTERAGNKETAGLTPDMSTLEKLGQTALPIRQPVYGDPIDLTQLSTPQKFGAGFQRNYKPTRRFV